MASPEKAPPAAAHKNYKAVSLLLKKSQGRMRSMENWTEGRRERLRPLWEQHVTL